MITPDILYAYYTAPYGDYLLIFANGDWETVCSEFDPNSYGAIAWLKCPGVDGLDIPSFFDDLPIHHYDYLSYEEDTDYDEMNVSRWFYQACLFACKSEDHLLIKDFVNSLVKCNEND